MPVLSRLRGWKYGFNSPFKVDIFFVSTRRFTNLKWGTRTPIQISDPMFMAVPLRAYGTFSIRVIEPATFFKELVGPDNRYTTEELIEAVRSRLLTRFGQYLRKAGKTVQEIFTNAAFLGEEILQDLKPYFKELGLDILEFNIENVTFPEEIQRQFMEQDMEMRKVHLAGKINDVNKYLQYQIASNIGKGQGPAGNTPNMMQQMLEMGMSMQMIQQMMGNTGNFANPASVNLQNMQAPPTQQQNQQEQKPSKDEVIKMLKELGELKEAGILTEEEFQQKKQELLAKL